MLIFNPLKQPRAPSTIEPYILRRKMRLTCLADSLSLTKKNIAPAKPKWKKQYTASKQYTHIYFSTFAFVGRQEMKKIANARDIFLLLFSCVLFSFFFAAAAAFSLLKSRAHTAIIQNNSMNIKITTYTSIH